MFFDTESLHLGVPLQFWEISLQSIWTNDRRDQREDYDIRLLGSCWWMPRMFWHMVKIDPAPLQISQSQRLTKIDPGKPKIRLRMDVTKSMVVIDKLIRILSSRWSASAMMVTWEFQYFPALNPQSCFASWFWSKPWSLRIACSCRSRLLSFPLGRSLFSGQFDPVK